MENQAEAMVKYGQKKHLSNDGVYLQRLHAGKQVPFQYIEYSRMTHYIKISIYSAYTYFKLLVDCYKLIGNKYMVHIKSFIFFSSNNCQNRTDQSKTTYFITSYNYRQSHQRAAECNIELLDKTSDSVVPGSLF